MKNLLLLIGLFFFACTTQAQETITTTTDEMAAPIAESSDEYKILEATVGTWTYTMTIWPMATGPEPTQTTGEAEGEWVLGGRFVRQVTRGEFLGEQFEGIGYLGYDRELEKYTYTCMMDTYTCMLDTRGNATMTSSGDYDAAAKSLTLEGEFMRTGRWMPFKVVLKLDSTDAYTMEVWQPGIYDILYKVYEVAYSRKK